MAARLEEMAPGMASKGKKGKDSAAVDSAFPAQPTGIEDLDSILQGGVPVGSSVLISGASGTGKTTTCFEILCRGAEKDEPGIIFLTSESTDRAIDNMTAYAFFSSSYVDDGKLTVKDMNELFKQLGIEHPDTGLSRDDAGKLLQAIVEAVDGAGAKRLVIDSLSGVLATFESQNGMRTFVKELVRTIAEKGVTVFMTSELAPDSVRYSSMGIEDVLVDGVIMLTNNESRGDFLRGLQVIKMRGSHHSRSRYVFDLTAYGIIIVPILKSYTRGGGE